MTDSRRPLRKTALRAFGLLRDQFNRDMGELIELAASEDGIDLSLGWKLDFDAGAWVLAVEPQGHDWSDEGP